MTTDFRHTLKALPLTVAALALCADVAYANNFGQEVVNVANITYTIGDSTIKQPTNAAVFTIQPPQERPTIEFFRYSPNAPSPDMVQINGSDYSPSGSLEGPFVSVGPAIRSTNKSGVAKSEDTAQVLDLSDPLPLIPAYTYLSGELMFVRVDYVTGNKNSGAIDVLPITLEADNGDSVVLQLHEESADSGQFWAYIPTTTSSTPSNDNRMTTVNNTNLQASYVDTGTTIEAVVDSALVNPSNFVFDSVTGAPIDGAEVTLLDLATGQPATVYGVDGFSIYPSTVITGETTQDASGLLYEQENGLFTFPYLEPGNYAIEVKAPDGYNFSSQVSVGDLGSGKTGEYFVIDASYGKQYSVDDVTSLRFDVPLDPDAQLVVNKVADRSDAGVGDFVGYTVSVANSGAATIPLNLADTLPLGFRYVPGTARIEDAPVADPAVADTANLLTFPMGSVAPGETVNISYALEVTPGAVLGDAVNEAVVRDNSGDAVSNVARAAIRVREDLLRDRSTLVGRISEQSCDADEEWAREIERGVGVQGVRLYMETGAYAVSDADGLYHFEGITEGTHVVQVDEETLPEGFELMTCEENTRYAGSNYSKFVEIQGGGIWRANFYLKRTGEVTETVEEERVSDITEYRQYDREWLNTQDNSPEWVYPATDMTPSIPSVNVGIKHPSDGKVELSLNGKPVPRTNLIARESSEDGRTMITRWKGVDILKGENTFIARVFDANGHVIKTIERTTAYVDTVARAYGVPDKSTLIADGRTVPTIAIRLEDEAGRAVHAGRSVKVVIEDPYRLHSNDTLEGLEGNEQDLLSPLSAEQNISVGQSGLLNLKLEPTLRTGKVTVQVTLDNGRIIPVYMYLQPEQRDWIMVGLAEGSVGYETIKDKAVGLSSSESDTVKDGRVAFFAKGMIKGNWLMTLAVDTDKRRGDRDGDFIDEIDPNAYYTLYGDRSYQDFEAQSRYPVYLKLEKKTAYAVFGDFNTDITEGRLSSYNRRLSGLKAEYIGENIQVLGFAAETNQGFGRAELPADGTSGGYILPNKNILAQSEEIWVETRDRDRPDVVLDKKRMVRYLDYTLDYLTGELIFRLPVDATDFDFNPNVIVATYETSEDAERNITAGGRVQAELLEGKLSVGSSIVSENGSNLTRGSKQLMVGVDAVAQVTDNTELRVEYAITEDQSTPGSKTHDAKLLEVIHTSDKVSAEAFFREEDGGFGLGQTSSATNDVRRYGAKAKVKVREFEDEKTGRRNALTVEGSLLHEDNLSTGDSRDTAEIMARHQGQRISVAAGLRSAQDNFVDPAQDDRSSLLAVTQAQLSVPKHGATFTVSHEQPLGGDKDEVSTHPQRTVLGVDKTLTKRATAKIRHEILKGASQDTQNTAIGLSFSAWKGGEITASTDMITQDSSRRLGGTIGLDQQVRLNDKWSASAGVRSHKVFEEQGDYIEVNPDAAVSAFETNDDFTSAYLGVGYRGEVTTGSARLEGRRASDGETYIGTAAAARELSEELSIAAATRATYKEDIRQVSDQHQIDARFGLAWRPRGEDTIVFDRLDYGTQTNTQGETRTKLVNNIAVNHMVSDRWQLSANHGIKYVRDNIAGQNLKSTTNLVGAETRFDITEKIDLGLHGSAMINDKGQVSYSYGPSIGVSPVKNVWVSAGYNVEGFKDDDFEAAEYSEEGLYLKLRVKFDQNTARGLLRRISPDKQVD